MRVSDDQEMIFFNMGGGSFISASDALNEHFDGPIWNDETALQVGILQL